MNIAELESEYNNKKESYSKIINIVKFILKKEIDRKKIKYHSFYSRIKEFDSFRDKIKRKNIKDPFNEIYDLVGFRIVCLFLSDIEKIGDIIKSTFKTIEEDNKIANTKVDTFGYMSIHFKVKFKDTSDFGNKDLNNIPFEIQVRTIVQDAWASISHYLDYKQEIGMPIHLKRNLHALSGLFYLADAHFGIIKREHFRYITTGATNEE